MFNIFPRKILAPEVTARRRAAVNGVQQIQLLDDARRGQVIRLAHRGSQTVILADAGAEGIHIKGRLIDSLTLAPREMRWVDDAE